MLSVFSHKESEAVSGSFESWVMVLISTTLQSNNLQKKIVSASTAHSNGWKEKNIHLYIYFNNFLSGRRAVIEKKKNKCNIHYAIFIWSHEFEQFNDFLRSRRDIDPGKSSHRVKVVCWWIVWKFNFMTTLLRKALQKQPPWVPEPPSPMDWDETESTHIHHHWHDPPWLIV